MAIPEKRWQLLLVADDGRIIPFKRIKGIAMTLAVLLVILGLVCAGLAWQLTAEKVRHRRTEAQLTDAKRQVVHYKSEHELIAAELVLAEARMEKAGLLIPSRETRTLQQAPAKAVEAKPDSEPKTGNDKKAPESIATASQTAVNQPIAAPQESVAKGAVSEAAPAEAATEPKQPVVAVDDLEIKHDAGKKILLARFRIKNTGPRSSPVAGRCVVVLKADQMDPGQWLAMPSVTLVSGKPDGGRGQAFKISRFKDMEIKAMGQTDPSTFNTAAVYVFDSSGETILEKDFAIDLPAPKPEPETVSTEAAQPAEPPETPPSAAVPAASVPANTPIEQPAPVEDLGEAAGNPPTASTPEADAKAVPPTVPTKAPVDDPSLTEGVEPVKKEDVRSRF